MIIFFLKELIKPIVLTYRLAKNRGELIKKYPNIVLLGKFKVFNSKFGTYNRLCDCVVNNSELGDFTYVSSGSYINNCKIGSFSCIGPNVSIGLGSHPTKDFISVHPIFYSPTNNFGITFSDKKYFNEYENTEIGNDVWIGANVVIKSGIIIEDGVIVAAGSVVTKNISAYSIVGGIPARVIKKRFEDDEVLLIRKSKWWTKDPLWLKQNFKNFHSLINFKKYL